MADPSAALTGTQTTGLPNAPATMLQAQQNVGQLLAAETKADDELQSGLKTIDDRNTKQDVDIDRKIAGIPVVTLPADAGKPFTPPPATDPKQIWSSAAMIVAALGSLFTRQPLTTAMNAAAAAINAYHKGDIDAANYALQQWKAAQDTALKVATFEQEATNDLVERMKALKDQNDKEAQAEKRDLVVEYNARKAALQNQVAAQFHSSDDVLRYEMGMETNTVRMAEAAQKVMESNLVGRAFSDWQKAHPNATNEQKVIKYGQIVQEVGHQPSDIELDRDQNTTLAHMQASVPGKNYDAATANIAGVMEMDPNAPASTKTIIDQVAGLDKYIQSQNGNRAIRGFQMQMLQHDMGILNGIRVKAMQIGGSGMVTPDMVREMQKVAQDLVHVAALQYGDYITRMQWTKWHSHLDPVNYLPPNWHPEEDPQAQQFPSPFASDPSTMKDVEYLKSHASDTMAWVYFDDHYGTGSAALVMEPPSNIGGSNQTDEETDAGAQ